MYTYYGLVLTVTMGTLAVNCSYDGSDNWDRGEPCRGRKAYGRGISRKAGAF